VRRKISGSLSLTGRMVNTGVLTGHSTQTDSRNPPKTRCVTPRSSPSERLSLFPWKRI
jgi:hypothetical protein